MADSPTLRDELEAAYGRVRQAILARDYDAFVNLVEPGAHTPIPAREDFMREVAIFKRTYPDLRMLKFFKVERSSAWAGYYAARDLGDPRSQCALAFRFHRMADQWKLRFNIRFSMVPKSVTTRRLLVELGSNPQFRLPGQPGFFED